MIFENCLDSVPSKESCVLYSVFRERVQKQRFERSTQPFMSRNIKTHLLSPENRLWQFASHQFTQHEFKLRAANLRLFWKRKRKFADPVIQEWRAHFE